MILPIYFLSISFSLSSNSWISIWIGIEINLLTFIFIILETKTFNSTERCMKYFLIQSVGSLIFLFSVSVQTVFFNEAFFIYALVPPLALILKSGIAPLHLWTPDIRIKFSPLNLFLFITLQKIIPIIILFSSWRLLTKWFIPLNIIIGSLGGVTQASINKIIIFSSINNSGWIMLRLTESIVLFYLFFLIYSIINLLLINFIIENKIKWTIQIKCQNFFKKILFVRLILSFRGLPPFIGFIPKWIILKKIIINLPLISLIRIIISIFTLFFYIKLTIYILLYSSLHKKWSINLSTNPTSLGLVLLNLASRFIFILLS